MERATVATYASLEATAIDKTVGIQPTVSMVGIEPTSARWQGSYALCRPIAISTSFSDSILSFPFGSFFTVGELFGELCPRDKSIAPRTLQKLVNFLVNFCRRMNYLALLVE